MLVSEISINKTTVFQTVMKKIMHLIDGPDKSFIIFDILEWFWFVKQLFLGIIVAWWSRQTSQCLLLSRDRAQQRNSVELFVFVGVQKFHDCLWFWVCCSFFFLYQFLLGNFGLCHYVYETVKKKVRWFVIIVNNKCTKKEGKVQIIKHAKKFFLLFSLILVD